MRMQWFESAAGVDALKDDRARHLAYSCPLLSLSLCMVQRYESRSKQGMLRMIVTYNYLLQSMIRSQPKMERQAEDVFRHMMQCGIKPNHVTQIHLARVVGLERARNLCEEFNIEACLQCFVSSRRSLVPCADLQRTDAETLNFDKL
eukprot:Skav219867  [mRNA]  locus=scaffold777:39152:40558:+ [translate_table: standard]